MVRSPSPMKCDSALSSVVLPEPVPPDTMMFRRHVLASLSTFAIAWDMLPCCAIRCSVMLRFENFRMEIDAP